MIEWINSHGVDVIVGYLVFAAVVGSMPALPENAGYLARWGYGTLHALSMNFRSALSMFKLNVPPETKEREQ